MHFRLRPNLFLDVNVVFLQIQIPHLQTQSAVMNNLTASQRPPVCWSELGGSREQLLHCDTHILLFIIFGGNFDVILHRFEHQIIYVLNPAKMVE